MLETLQTLDFTPFILSFKLAGVTTLILFFFSLPLAWYLSQTESRMKPFVESFTALPIVLPPSVLGFYFLVTFENYDLAFTFEGLVIASCFYSLPFMVQPLQGGFESLNKNILEASYLAGKGKFITLTRVALPNIKPALLTAIIITFAHTVGELGVVLMVGGNIPDETKVASVAIYEVMDTLEYDKTHIYAGIMVLMSFLVLLMVYLFNHKQNRKMRGVTL
jgi:molybdate transport system permease protein